MHPRLRKGGGKTQMSQPLVIIDELCITKIIHGGLYDLF